MEDRKTRRDNRVEETDVQQLVHFPFFAGLDERHLRSFLKDAVVLRYDPSQTVFRRGERANSLFVILNGQISVGAYSDHTFTTVQTLNAGDVLGWSWIVPPYRWRFDAIALERTRMLVMDGFQVRNMCERDHDLGYHVMRRIAILISGRLEAARAGLLQTESASS